MMRHSLENVAILGATGYIGKSLAKHLSTQKKKTFFLFARSPKKLKLFLETLEKSACLIPSTFSAFPQGQYDVIINCVGVGSPRAVRKAGRRILEITEKFDELVLRYLESHPKTLYIHLSSGAVSEKKKVQTRGRHEQPSGNRGLRVPEEYYTLAKHKAEAKHRALPNRHIVDVRIFSFFSRFIDASSGYLMADILNALRRKKKLVTSPDDIQRDYVGAGELWDLIKQVAKTGGGNDFFDIYSAQPTSKFSLLKFLKKKYGLQYSIQDVPQKKSPTGLKSQYYSKNKKARKIGYFPKKTSLEIIDNEIKYCLWP